MAWQTGQRICREPSCSWFPRLSRQHWVLRVVLALGVLIFAGSARAQVAQEHGAEPAYVHDCQPCVVTPDKRVTPYSFYFDLDKTGTERAVKAIHVKRDSGPVQQLAVPKMEPVEGDLLRRGGCEL